MERMRATIERMPQIPYVSARNSFTEKTRPIASLKSSIVVWTLQSNSLTIQFPPWLVLKWNEIDILTENSNKKKKKNYHLTAVYATHYHM